MNRLKNKPLSSIPKIAVVILAAGSSSRLGTAKQLLPWKQTTLLEHSIKTILELNCDDVFVILGANHNLIKSKIDCKKVDVLVNDNWELGLGNSIASGVKYIQESKEVDGILLVLADQPLIDSKYLKSLIDKFEVNNNKIIASSYSNGKKGVPVLFDKEYFEELSKLNGDKGAKTLLDKYVPNVFAINAEHLVSDIDTEEDYDKLYKVNHQ